MARTHGSGRACYKEHVLPVCEECKEHRREYVRRWLATPEGRESNHRSCARYRSTAKGQLALVRFCAKKRGS